MRVALTSILLLMTATAVAQTPYAGMQARQIKALSEQQISDLDAGRGMGLALAAELNGYPGPSHVLELADETGEGRGRDRGRTEDALDAHVAGARDAPHGGADRGGKLGEPVQILAEDLDLNVGA